MNNTTCTCEQLFKCIKGMSVYDTAVLFADGYIVTDFNDENFGSFTTVDLNLYDVANGALYEKFLAIQQMTDGPKSHEQCTNLLMEMHKPCDGSSTAETCSNVNTQSYQLSVDQVCEGVDTHTKLDFGAIFDVYSLKPNCLRVQTGPFPFSEGTLDVSVDSGHGYVKVTPESSSYAPNQIVVDACFASIEGVKVSNPTTNGWSGYIELSSDNRKTYSSMFCSDNCICPDTSCSSDSKDTMIVVDGNDDGASDSNVIKCLNGLECTFMPKALAQCKLFHLLLCVYFRLWPL